MSNEGRTAAAVGEVFAANLSVARRARGLSQSALSTALAKGKTSIHPTAIAKIEAGTRAVSIGEAVAICDALGVDIAAMTAGPIRVQVVLS